MSAQPLIPPDLAGKYSVTLRRDPCLPTQSLFVAPAHQLSFRSKLHQRFNSGFARKLALYLHAPTLGEGVEGNARHISQQMLSALQWEIERVSQALNSKDRVLAEVKVFLGTADSNALKTLRQHVQKIFVCTHETRWELALDAEELQQVSWDLFSSLNISDLTVRVTDTHMNALVHLPIYTSHTWAGNLHIELASDTRNSFISAFVSILKGAALCQPETIVIRDRPEIHSSACLAWAIDSLNEAGYSYMGVGFFCRRGGALDEARRNERLSWWMGNYHTTAACDVVGAGPGAASRLGDSLFQHAERVEEYFTHLGKGELPVSSVCTINQEHMMRLAIIESLICHGEVDMSAIGNAFLVDWRGYFAEELVLLDDYVADGLLKWDGDWLVLLDLGKLFAGAVYEIFDLAHGN